MYLTNLSRYHLWLIAGHNTPFVSCTVCYVKDAAKLFFNQFPRMGFGTCSVRRMCWYMPRQGGNAEKNGTWAAQGCHLQVDAGRKLGSKCRHIGKACEDCSTAVVATAAGLGESRFMEI